jgi:hypothetical protein
VLDELGGAGDVISMGMRLNNGGEFQAVLGNHAQITLKLRINWVDDDGLARSSIP